MEERDPLVVDPLEKVMLNGQDKFTYANSLMFSWSHSDMVGISPTVASHKLNIIPTVRPIRQKVRYFNPGSPSNHSPRRLHPRSEVPQVVSQRGGSSKERRKVVSMGGLH